MAEVQAERALAEARLRDSPRRERMTWEAITAMVATLRDIIGVLATADPAGWRSHFRSARTLTRTRGGAWGERSWFGGQHHPRGFSVHAVTLCPAQCLTRNCSGPGSVCPETRFGRSRTTAQIR